MKLGQVLKEYRWALRKNVRDMAKELGISHATLSRIERGENMDGVTLARIISWLIR